MSDEALRAYLDRRQTQSSAGDTLKTHLARLRLQSAREKANKERRAYRPPTLQYAHQSAASPGLVYFDAQQRESSRSAARRAQPNLAGPVARSWSQHAASPNLKLSLEEPSESLQGILVLERAALLATLKTPFHPDEAHAVCSLVDHCLLCLLLDLLSVVEADVQELAEGLECVPTHLKQRLMWQSQTVAPMPPSAIKALLLSCASSQASAQEQAAAEAEQWDQDDDGLNSTDQPLTALHLAFSPLTPIHLRDFFNIIPRTAITHLDLTHTPNISLGQVLLGLLPLLPNLIDLSLASKEIKSNILSPSAFLSKLSLATPLLQALDLSFNNWIDLQALEGINWQQRWLEMQRLGLRETPAAGKGAQSGIGMQDVVKVQQTRSGSLAAANRCTLRTETQEKESRDQKKSAKQLIEGVLLRRRDAEGTIRPWVEVIL